MGFIRDSWDYLLVYPLVLKFLQERNYPLFVSSSAIQDYLGLLPEMDGQRVVRLEWDVAHALNESGYRRISNTGKGFVKTCIGIPTVPEPAQFRELAVLVI